jgi:DNA invertase Pin-like site-specific DNA recombinase
MAGRNRTPLDSNPQEIRSVALYARVSTARDQHPEMQLAELREYASKRGWIIAAEYVDQGVSGSKMAFIS